MYYKINAFEEEFKSNYSFEYGLIEDLDSSIKEIFLLSFYENKNPQVKKLMREIIIELIKKNPEIKKNNELLKTMIEKGLYSIKNNFYPKSVFDIIKMMIAENANIIEYKNSSMFSRYIDILMETGVSAAKEGTDKEIIYILFLNKDIYSFIKNNHQSFLEENTFNLFTKIVNDFCEKIITRPIQDITEKYRTAEDLFNEKSIAIEKNFRNVISRFTNSILTIIEKREPEIYDELYDKYDKNSFHIVQYFYRKYFEPEYRDFPQLEKEFILNETTLKYFLSLLINYLEGNSHNYNYCKKLIILFPELTKEIINNIEEMEEIGDIQFTNIKNLIQKTNKFNKDYYHIYVKFKETHFDYILLLIEKYKKNNISESLLLRAINLLADEITDISSNKYILNDVRKLSIIGKKEDQETLLENIIKISEHFEWKTEDNPPKINYPRGEYLSNTFDLYIKLLEIFPQNGIEHIKNISSYIDRYDNYTHGPFIINEKTKNKILELIKKANCFIPLLYYKNKILDEKNLILFAKTIKIVADNNLNFYKFSDTFINIFNKYKNIKYKNAFQKIILSRINKLTPLLNKKNQDLFFNGIETTNKYINNYKEIIKYFDFYIELLNLFPEDNSSYIEEIAKAIENNILTKNINTESKEILIKFIKDTNIFNAKLYALYLQFTEIQFNELLKLITECKKTNIDIEQILNIINLIFKKYKKIHIDTIINCFRRLIVFLNEKNQTLILENILKTTNHLKKVDQLNKYLNFYIEILTIFPRNGGNFIEGITNGLIENILPETIKKEKTRSITEFIQSTNSFSPRLYSLVKERGKTFFNKIFIFSAKILLDKIGRDEILYFIEAKKETTHLSHEQIDLLLSTFMTRIPMSGTSFASYDEFKKYFMRFLASGDRRVDIPNYWKKYSYTTNISDSSFQLKQNENPELNDKVDFVLNHLINTPEKLPEEKKLSEKLAKYINNGLSEKWEEKRDFLSLFLPYAAQTPSLKEKIEKLNTDAYYKLCLLEEIINNPDNLKIILKDFLEKVKNESPEIFISEINGKNPIPEPKNIKKILENSTMRENDPEKKNFIISNILRKYNKNEIENILLPLFKEDDLIAQGIRLFLNEERKENIGIEVFQTKFLQDISNAIRQEKNKYESIKTEMSNALEFRVVKGIPYAIWGITAGVCIVKDYKLWEKPEFKLLAMINKNTGMACGFIHLYETQINGHKILTIPGIEPSVEYLKDTDSSELYNIIETVLKDLAKKGGYKELYIPTSDSISSNRSEILREIKKRNYKKTRLNKIIHWNTMPTEYPFDEVYVIDSADQ